MENVVRGICAGEINGRGRPFDPFYVTSAAVVPDLECDSGDVRSASKQRQSLSMKLGAQRDAWDREGNQSMACDGDLPSGC